ncbi:hypothetical protein IQ269_01895 [Tychonema sp. LEGE 07199]|nr:hypothetical protein [Tychonema sp. LEGE 07199]
MWYGSKEDGRWKMEDGRWKMEDGRWKMEDGRWKMERRKDLVMSPEKQFTAMNSAIKNVLTALAVAR